MKINIINFIAVLIMGLNSLVFTNSTAVVLSHSCDGVYELQCDSTPSHTICCGVCSSTGDIADCDIVR